MMDVVAPFVRLSGYTPAPAALRLLPENVARQFLVVPLGVEQDTLSVASARPLDAATQRALASAIRYPVRVRRATLPDVRTALARFYHGVTPRTPLLTLEQALVHLGYLTQETVQRLRAQPTNLSFAQVCLQSNLIREEDFVEALGWQYNLPAWRWRALAPQTHLAPLIPLTIARAQKIVPLWWIRNTLIAGTAAPQENDARLAAQFQFPLWLVVYPPTEWNHLYERLYLQGRASPPLDENALLETLVRQGALTTEMLHAARALAQHTQQPLSEVLLARRVITQQQWLAARAEMLGVRVGYTPAPRNGGTAPLAECLPASIARQCAVVPLEYDAQREKIVLGTSQPQAEVAALVQALTRARVEMRLLDEREVQARLSALYGDTPSALPDAPTLSDLLLGLGIITPAQWQQAQESTRRLVELNYLDAFDLTTLRALQTGLPVTRLERARFDPDLVTRLAPDLARRHTMLPWVISDGVVWTVIADPFDTEGLLAMERALGLPAQPILATPQAIRAVSERFFGSVAVRVTGATRALVEAMSQRGVLSNAGAAYALQQIEQGVPVDQAIGQASGDSAHAVTRALAEYAGVAWVDLQLREESVPAMDPTGQPVLRRRVHDPVDATVARLLDVDTARRVSALPIARMDGALVVAFADPLFESARREIEDLLKVSVRPVLAARAALDAAIQRVLGRQNLGTRLLLAGIISRAQLNDALDLAQRTGVRLGRALVTRGYVTFDQLAQFLAEQARLPFFDLRSVTLDHTAARRMDEATERALGILPLAVDEHQVTLAMVDPLNEEAREVAARLTGRTVRPVLVSEQDLEEAFERIYGTEYLERSVSELLSRAPQDSAYWVLSRGQKIAFALVVLFSALWLVADWRSYIIVLNALSTTFYLGFSAYKFYLAYRAITHELEVPVSNEEVAALDDRELPIYTILVPVYKEAEVLPDLLQAINRLDYPATKLDVKVLMEADDTETIQAFEALKMPAHFQGIVVPVAPPRTKPKACNYGLIHARGEYVVIYDAEDLPEPDQLKRILVAFRKSPPNVVCIQSKLNYYNRHQNLLTAWFTVEYSMWFDLFLPGLDASGAPIPLGGTSNHFKRSALIEAGAWDPYNVTEDADLGVRIFKRGYRTAIVDTTTYEEANSEIYNWIRQRSRWIKGYIQTWLVHMRHPLKLYRELGFTAFWGFQFVVGGTFFAALLNPIYWFLTTLWFLTHWGFIQEIFPGIVFYSGAVCLYLGNFAFTYLNVAGAMRRGYYDMVKYALLSPLYWGLMSIGAWKGFWQLVTRPYFWEKTKHGLFRGEPDVKVANQLRDLV
jgi:cellulose synthase/poly-beta-1,6-N-acetylglucosamine synthase-like glycosyltransferase